VVGVDADLLDVGVPVDTVRVQEQVPHDPSVLDRHPRAAGPLVHGEQFRRRGVVVGDRHHPESAEPLPRGAFHVLQAGQVGRFGGSQDDGRFLHARSLPPFR
jgi:hypothetical protein